MKFNFFLYRDEYINFILFFVEKDVLKWDIIFVIEIFVFKVNEIVVNVVLVDCFEIEFDYVKIKIEWERMLVDFNRI